MAAILDFKMAATKNILLAFSLVIIEIFLWFWCLNICFNWQEVHW